LDLAIYFPRPPPPRPLASPHLQHHGDDIEAIENDGWNYVQFVIAIVKPIGDYASIAVFLAAKSGRGKAPARQPFSKLRAAVSLAQGCKGFWVHPTSGRTSDRTVSFVLLCNP
jgi:hypothetical protein